MQIPVSIHFYPLSAFPPGSWHSRLRGRVTTLLSEYVHCNYQIGNWVYNVSTKGYELIEGAYMVEPSATVRVWVDEADVDRFIHRFVEQHLKGPRWYLWAVFGLAALPLFCALLDNCSSFPKELTGGGERTPSRLFVKLAQAQR